MKILVGSNNPVKIEAVKEAFSHYFREIEVLGVETESGVPAQPVNDHTFMGARNRAIAVKFFNEENKLGADYFVGIEGGISKIFEHWFAYGCMCVINKTGKESFGISPSFQLPESVFSRLLEGEELGNVMDEIMNQENTKQRGGAISFFTNGIMNRKELYVGGLKVAVIPFLHENLYYNI
jgi:inosine/xanthosine triphosphatase